jgi:hypothetical protein
MKKQAPSRKLTLNRETIANLEAGQLIEVAGAGGRSLDFTICFTMCTCPDTK